MENTHRKAGAQTVVIYFPCNAPVNLYTQHSKRIADVIVASVALVACLPIFAAACIAIMMETPGNPLFRQRRAGRDGVFEIFKLRTMLPHTEDKGFTTAIDDARVTRIGRFLRRTKIDELPQLINVLKGDMSIVGPRPLSVTECEYIETLGISNHLAGFYPKVRPGLIGLEQLNRKRCLSYIDRFKFNAEYEQGMCFELDARIFVRSFFMCAQLSALSACALAAEVVALACLFSA